MPKNKHEVITSNYKLVDKFKFTNQSMSFLEKQFPKGEKFANEDMMLVVRGFYSKIQVGNLVDVLKLLMEVRDEATTTGIQAIFMGDYETLERCARATKKLDPVQNAITHLLAAFATDIEQDVKSDIKELERLHEK